MNESKFKPLAESVKQAAKIVAEGDGTAAIIYDLVSSFVAKPEALKVGAQWSDDGRSCFFGVAGDPSDDPILIGFGGSHVDAVRALVEKIGTAKGKVFTFKLKTVPRSLNEPNRPRRDRVEAIEHDPRKSRDLLCRLLSALGFIAFSVNVGAGAGARTALSYVFTVQAPYEVTGKLLSYFDEDPGVSLITIIGTLFRAIAKREGVRYQINVETVR